MKKNYLVYFLIKSVKNLFTNGHDLVAFVIKELVFFRTRFTLAQQKNFLQFYNFFVDDTHLSSEKKKKFLFHQYSRMHRGASPKVVNNFSLHG